MALLSLADRPVTFPCSRGHLKPEWATIEQTEAARPDVAFFLRSNPGYISGEELQTLAKEVIDQPPLLVGRIRELLSGN
jgi:hypothetical protein